MRIKQNHLRFVPAFRWPDDVTVAAAQSPEQTQDGGRGVAIVGNNAGNRFSSFGNDDLLVVEIDVLNHLQASCFEGADANFHMAIVAQHGHF